MKIYFLISGRISFVNHGFVVLEYYSLSPHVDLLLNCIENRYIMYLDRVIVDASCCPDIYTHILIPCWIIIS